MHLKSNILTVGSLVATVLLGLLQLASCTAEPGDTRYVAKVDKMELTEDQLKAELDSTVGSRQRVQDIVNTWIISELLFQEASRRGLADTEELRRQLETTRKRLAIAALLEQELYAANDTASITDQQVASYLSSSRSEFALREDVILASYVLFSERDAANAFRSQVLKGTPWLAALQHIQQDTLLSRQLVQVANRQYFTQSTLYPQELWKLAGTLRNNDISFALKTSRGYYVLQLHRLKRQGEVPDFDYVRQDVRDRLLMDERRERYEQLVAGLRTRHRVDIRLQDSDTATPSQDPY